MPLLCIVNTPCENHATPYRDEAGVMSPLAPSASSCTTKREWLRLIVSRARKLYRWLQGCNLATHLSVSGSTSASLTATPPLAAERAIPDPIVPDPKMVSLSIFRRGTEEAAKVRRDG